VQKQTAAAEKEKKEKSYDFSHHNGSLLRQQPGATAAATHVLTDYPGQPDRILGF